MRYRRRLRLSRLSLRCRLSLHGMALAEHGRWIHYRWLKLRHRRGWSRSRLRNDYSSNCRLLVDNLTFGRRVNGRQRAHNRLNWQCRRSRYRGPDGTLRGDGSARR